MKKSILFFFALLTCTLAIGQNVPATEPTVKSITYIPQASPPTNTYINKRYLDVDGNYYKYDGSSWVLDDHTIDTDTQLNEADVDGFVANNGYSIGAHTTDTDTQLTDSEVAAAALAEGFVAGAHTIDTNTQLSKAEIEAMAFVTGAHTVDTDTHADQTEIEGLGFVIGAEANTIDKDGTTVDNQIMVATGDGLIEGSPQLTYTTEGLTLARPQGSDSFNRLLSLLIPDLGTLSSNWVQISLGKAGNIRNSAEFSYIHKTDGGFDNIFKLGHYAVSNLDLISDGTSKFYGNVTIKTGTAPAIFELKSELDASLIISADTNNVGETNNPLFRMQQDAGGNGIDFGLSSSTDSPFIGCISNGLFINTDEDTGIVLAVNEQVVVTLVSSGATIAGNLTVDTDTFFLDASGDKVGIGTLTPDENAVLDVTSTSKGLLFPRLTTTQRDAMTTPSDGLVIYNITINKLQVRAGGVWVSLH